MEPEGIDGEKVLDVVTEPEALSERATPNGCVKGGGADVTDDA